MTGWKDNHLSRSILPSKMVTVEIAMAPGPPGQALTEEHKPKSLDDSFGHPMTCIESNSHQPTRTKSG